MANTLDQHYVIARKALLDVLEALGVHKDSVILVGAQAVYIHTGEAEFAISPFTYDADLALDPRNLADKPIMTEVMRSAGFVPTEQPGLYKKCDGSQVDLLVPDALGGAGRRGARLGPHGNRAAMKVRGIEGALVDHKLKNISSLEKKDQRSHRIKVAGPAAHGKLRRQDDKDAFDIYRILRAIDTHTLAAKLGQLK
jgi:hypothetical protein